MPDIGRRAAPARARAWAVGAVLLLAGACSSGDGVPEGVAANAADRAGVDGSGGAPVATGATGGTAADAPALPDDLPTEVPDGGVVRNVSGPVDGTMHDATEVRLLYPAGDFDAVVAFYDDWFDERGIVVEAYDRPDQRRWRWDVEVDGGPRTQEILLTVGGTYDEGGAVLRIRYDAPPS